MIVLAQARAEAGRDAADRVGRALIALVGSLRRRWWDFSRSKEIVS